MDKAWLKEHFDAILKEFDIKKDDAYEVLPEDLYEEARKFWKNNNKDYSSDVGQLTGLLSDFGAYLLNKKSK